MRQSLGVQINSLWLDSAHFLMTDPTLGGMGSLPVRGSGCLDGFDDLLTQMLVVAVSPHDDIQIFEFAT